jgi:radical SAM superfamily enzyme YgiQ (UPF0313 family)
VSEWLSVRALLISTYDLGRQPFGLASAAAALAANGVEVSCVDLAKQRLETVRVKEADVVAFYLPMHTATRLALPIVDRVRAFNPAARLIAFGLYAPLNAALLRERGVAGIIGGEFEDDLVSCVLGRPGSQSAPTATSIPRVQFRIPLRESLPPLSRYAMLQVGTERKTAGYTEASRGCKHRCRHCPIVPVYDGRFRIVPIPLVLADVRSQVAAGARHITFGDPDFFNGIRHATELMRAFAIEFPDVTYDVTIKIEHLLQHEQVVSVLRETGCLFVTSAVESVDDRVLQKLEKGHTRADFERAVTICRHAGVTLAPTFVAFTPWITLAGCCDLLHVIDDLDLVEQVSPIQLAIRLLIPEGSRLLELEDIRQMIGSYSPASLTYPWQHADPAVDALQQRIERLVGKQLGADRRSLFNRIWEEAHHTAGITSSPRPETGALPRAAIPYLNEPWYC